MKKNLLIVFSVVAMAACSSSDSDNSFTPNYEITVKTDTTVSVTINSAATYQTIEGFASSDAWNMEYVGKYWSTSAKEGIAKLLFSQNIKNNQPEGIGLSMWRVNLGGGSSEQGDDSGINDKPERRAECFQTASGGYDWTKAAGQRYFMEQAKLYGVSNFVLFSNTPPVYYTKNGKAYSESGAYANLKTDCYNKFASFLATCASHFNSQGYNISYISPVNEPQYNWTGGQEGSGWQNAEVAKLVRALDSQLSTEGLSSTKILVGEAGAWNYLYETASDVGAERSNVINDFFNASSANYIGNLSHVPSLVCAHSYWLDTSLSQIKSTRQSAAAAAKARGLSLAQTEWSMMSETYDGITSYDNATYMDLAMAMAGVLHYDLTTAGVTSWSYWTTCERERWGQMSRFYLIRLTPTGGDYGDLTTGGTYEASKNLWVLGNYSLFVRPGYKRIDVTSPSSSVLASAYISPNQDKLVVVYTNLGKKSVKVEATINVSGKTATNPQEYVTSSSRNLRLVGSEETNVLEARSVATVVYDLQ